jgi:hypothetical protein
MTQVGQCGNRLSVDFVLCCLGGGGDTTRKVGQYCLLRDFTARYASFSLGRPSLSHEVDVFIDTPALQHSFTLTTQKDDNVVIPNFVQVCKYEEIGHGTKKRSTIFSLSLFLISLLSIYCDRQSYMPFVPVIIIFNFSILLRMRFFSSQHPL